ncbi:Phospholipase D zeta 1 (PLDzeta1) (Phospholipase D p1) (AtPLDp1) (Phospholipase D1 PHOX and PX-containing domain protein) [Durusdinium trenchii]|uniref:Phospholipase n=1 Tax=Durusdinium trenchii TaxID=1381693 RepID=A0ABP0J0B5_9DINO
MQSEDHESAILSGPTEIDDDVEDDLDRKGPKASRRGTLMAQAHEGASTRDVSRLGETRIGSGLGLAGVPEIPPSRRRAESRLTIEDIKIPPPEIEVHEVVTSAKAAISGLSGGEIVYRVDLSFGEFGEWDLPVTRTNLSSLISKLQMNKLFGNVGFGNRLRRGAGRHNVFVGRDGKRQEDVSVRGSSAQFESLVLPSPSPVRESFGSATDAMRHHSGAEMGISGAESTMDGSALAEKRILYGMTKLLFVPAVGTAARVRKVKENRRRIIQSILTTLLADEEVRNSAPAKEFLRISTLTFDTRFGVSYKEGWVKVYLKPRAAPDEKLRWKGKVSCGRFMCACATDPSRAGCCLQPWYRRNRRMWAVVKPSFVALFADGPSAADGRQADAALLFGHYFEVYKGYGSTGSDRTIQLVGAFNTVRLKFQTKWEKKRWADGIIRALESTSALPSQPVPLEWNTTHEYQSFAPKRLHSIRPQSEICRARFLIDGKATFGAMKAALEAAESQIFIQGWWITPDLPLVRPAVVGDSDHSLLSVLERKAREGVKVVVLMYNEVDVALPLNTKYQLKLLEGADGNGNLFVIRHPEHRLLGSSTWFWSHHEKLVVVDQVHAFVGGLDLAWGRYDTPDHLLYDPHGNVDGPKEWPGIDFSNVRVKDFENISNPDRQQHPADCPRMPWHDNCCEYVGAIARDVARHFIHQWNFARFSLGLELSTPALVPMDYLPQSYLMPRHDSQDDATEFIDPEFLLDELPSARGRNRDASIAGNGHSQKEGDSPHQLLRYMSAPVVQRTSTFTSDSVINHSKARLGSPTGKEEEGVDDAAELSDAATITTEDEAEGNEVEGNGVEGSEVEGNEAKLDADPIEPADDQPHALNSRKAESEPSPTISPANGSAPGRASNGLLIASALDAVEEKEAANISTDPDPGASAAMPDTVKVDGNGEGHHTILADPERAVEQTMPKGDLPIPREFGYPVDAQVVRSLAVWSGASPGEKEHSIELAMRDLIDNSKRFVFIENQFFISGLNSDRVVSNRILESLYRRILRAHESKMPFRVFVVLPLLPGFEGRVAESPSIRRILYFQYRTICRGEDSLFFNLLKSGIDPDQYICFFGLRTWQGINSHKGGAILGEARLATELIYVHSKVLVVDDEACMIGSGNINDRSLSGGRDTEVSVVIEEPQTKVGAAGRPRFVHDYRMALFREHFGDAADIESALLRPWEDDHFKALRGIAQRNTEIFDEVFKVLPRDQCRKSDQLRAESEDKYKVINYSQQDYDKLQQVQGHAVLLPLQFLNDYDLRPGLTEDASGAVLPEEIFI